MLNLLHVRTFLTIVDESGIRAAAKALALSPSTVLEHLKQLEADLAAPLIVRGRGSVHPSTAGERFMPYARSLVATAQRVKELIASPVIRVAAASNVGIYLLQQPLAALRRDIDIEVELWIGPNPAVFERLDSGAADVVATEWWDRRRGFRAVSWLREPLVVIVAPDHRWAQRKSIDVQDLAEEPLLGGEPGSGTGTLLKDQLGATADRLRTVSGFGSTEAVKRAVRAGLGISVVMAAAVADEMSSGQLIGLKISGVDLAKEIWLVAPEHLPPGSPTVRLIAGLQHGAERASNPQPAVVSGE